MAARPPESSTAATTSGHSKDHSLRSEAAGAQPDRLRRRRGSGRRPAWSNGNTSDDPTYIPTWDQLAKLTWDTGLPLCRGHGSGLREMRCGQIHRRRRAGFITCRCAAQGRRWCSGPGCKTTSRTGPRRTVRRAPASATRDQVWSVREAPCRRRRGTESRGSTTQASSSATRPLAPPDREGGPRHRGRPGWQAGLPAVLAADFGGRACRSRGRDRLRGRRQTDP